MRSTTPIIQFLGKHYIKFAAKHNAATTPEEREKYRTYCRAFLEVVDEDFGPVVAGTIGIWADGALPDDGRLATAGLYIIHE